MLSLLHNFSERLEEKRDLITDWMATKRSEVEIPIYGSVDIRDAGWKVAVVDANHFPAGFNNVSKEEEPHLSELLKKYILTKHLECSWVHLYPESHTRNSAYVENLSTIKRLIENAGFRCTVGAPELENHGSLNGLSGPLKLDQVSIHEDEILVDGKKPCLILLNNDLTEGVLPGLSGQQVSPPVHMGWHRRRKSQHFEVLQNYVDELSELIGIDPWHLMCDWFVSEDKCLDKEKCRITLAAEIDEFLAKIQQKYDDLGIDSEPVVFLKNDSGTYGLGILTLKSGSEILELSNRKMKRLMYSKGGNDVENFLIQEGVPTSLKTINGGAVEPVVYLVAGEAASWFYRVNEKKGDLENLNSPSAKFVSISEAESNLTEHAHGWHALVAELSMLAMGGESEIS